MTRPPSRTRWRVRLVFAVVLAAAAIGIGALWIGRTHATANAAQALSAKADAGPAVATATATPGPAVRDVTLLGEAQPYQTATLYAQVSGYLKTMKVDRGDRVEKDQLLAEIASPEIEAQLKGAEATLANAKATLKRTLDLVDRHFVSQQAADDARTQMRTAQAAYDALRTQQSYQTIRAPFAGTITARYADPGALVQNASASQTSALPIVTVTDTRKLRVRVYVEQGDAAAVKTGDKAVVQNATNPDIEAEAMVSRTADQLDAQTRTMLAEIDLDNANNAFVPGSFVNVTLHIDGVSHPSVPSAALLLRGQQTAVAVLGEDNRMHVMPVKVASTDGTTAQIADGLAVGQTVVLNAGSIADGSLVRPVQ